MVPVEAMLCGTPVIAYGRGGARETVISGVSGLFFDAQTPESLQGAIDVFQNISFDPQKVRESALRFTKKTFQAKLLEFVVTEYQKYLK